MGALVFYAANVPAQQLVSYRCCTLTIEPPLNAPSGKHHPKRYPKMSKGTLTKRNQQEINTVPKYRVTASLLNMRKGPGTDHPVTAQLSSGTIVERLQRSDDGKWYQVQAEIDGDTVDGWVFTLYLSLVGAASTVLNAIVDLSHFNGEPDLEAAKDDGILAVIHKATQGVLYVDPMYVETRAQAKKAGLYWGAYHFGVGGDPVGQAEHFLKTAESNPADLLVLDLEPNPCGSSMSLDEAIEFVSYVHSRTRRWPVLYSGYTIKSQLGDRHSETLANCPFWLAQYAPTAIVPATWSSWTMWQYTDGGAGPQPHSVAGIGRCDRDKFNGDLQELQRFWGIAD